MASVMNYFLDKTLSNKLLTQCLFRTPSKAFRTSRNSEHRHALCHVNMQKA